MFVFIAYFKTRKNVYPIPATLRKRSLQLSQFDESLIKVLGYFEGSLELEDKFEVIPTIVTISKKNHGFLGNDVLNINSTNLINERK